MERFRNRFIKAGLAATMVFGVGTTARGAEPSPTPIVGIEPATPPEVERLDVSALVDAVKKGINTEVNPGFFNRMERRAKENPNKYFAVKKLPDGETAAYFPTGYEVGKQPKVGYTHTLTNGIGNDYNGVPAGLNFFQTHDDVWLQLGEEGSVKGETGLVLYNFDEIHQAVETYINIPRKLRDIGWTDAIPDIAMSYKNISVKGEGDSYLVGGMQNGFVINIHDRVEIPIVGTDIVPAIK